MAYRDHPFVTGQVYHIYNRGVEKRLTFSDSRDYQRFLTTLSYYQLAESNIRLSFIATEARENQLQMDTPRRVLILAYVLMPNHFHLLLRQETDRGISTFLQRSINSYTRAFNTRWDRVGHLFQGVTKSVLIESDEQFVHVSRYIHINPVVSGLVPLPEDWRWSSYDAYHHYPEHSSGLVDPTLMMQQFKTARDYQRFVNDHIDYARSLELIKHVTLEL